MPMNSQLSTFMALSGLAAASSHLTDARPAWIWAEDGKTLLWANPAGAAFFGVGTLAALSELSGLGRAPARPHIARVAASGPTERDTIDRLRFYRGLRVMLLTCACRRLDLPNGSSGALIVALDAPANAADGEETALLDFLGGEDHVAVLYRRDGTMLTGGAGELELPDADSVRAALRQAKHAPLRRDFTFGGALHQAAVLTLDSGSVLMVADAKGRPLAEDAAPAIAPDISPALDDAADAAVGMTEDRAEDTVPAAAVTEPPAPAIPPRSRLSMGGLFAFASGTRFLPAGRPTDTAAETPGPSAEATPAPDDVAAERPAELAIETAVSEAAEAEVEAEAPVEATADAELHEEAQEENRRARNDRDAGGRGGGHRHRRRGPGRTPVRNRSADGRHRRDPRSGRGPCPALGGRRGGHAGRERGRG